jgi:hypothetical protein
MGKEPVMLVKEGGINWCWFTRLEMEGELVRILEHYRIHKVDDEFTEEEYEAESHPNYYHVHIWRECENRVATHYYIPGVGWKEIVNPQYIFSYPWRGEHARREGS